MRKLTILCGVLVLTVRAFAAPEAHPQLKDDARILFLGNGGARTYWTTYFTAWVMASAEQNRLQVFTRLNNWDVGTWAERSPTILRAVKPDVVVFLSVKEVPPEVKEKLETACKASGARLMLEPTPVIADKTVGGDDDQRAAFAMMKLLGIAGTCHTMTVDCATLPKDFSVPVRTERPFIGFTYTPVVSPELSSFVVKAVNLSAEKAELTVPGRHFTLTRAELEKGVDIIRLASCWTPFRNASLALLKGAGDLNPLTVSLPEWETLVQKDLPDQDYSALYGKLESEFRAAASARFAALHALRQPVEFKLTLRPLGGQ